MGFLNLLALYYLPIVGLLILIYFFRKKRKTIPVPSFIPWRGLKQDTVRTRFFLADILFFLQLAALLLLIFFLTHPYFTSISKGVVGKNIILLIDTSASMQTREGKSTRFDLIKAEALRLVEKMGAGDSMLVISMHSSPQILSEFSKDKGKLKKIIKTLESLDTGTSLEEGLSLSLSLLNSISNGEVHVLTDKEAPELKDNRIRFVRHGKASDNIAITGLDIYQDMFKDYREREAYVTVKNFSEEPKVVLLKTFLDKEPLAEEAIELIPQEQRTIRVKGIKGPGLLKAELEPEDSLAADNHAYAIIKINKSVNVLVVTEDAFLQEELRKVEKATEQVKFTTITPSSYTTNLKDYDIAIFHRFIPEDYPRENALFISPLMDNKLFPIRGWTRGVRVIDWNNDHPIMRHLDYLEEIWIYKALHLEPLEGLKTLIKAEAESENLPLALAGTLQGHRVVVLGFDLAEFGLSKTKNMPILIMFLNILQWLNPEGVEASQIKTGEHLVINLYPEKELKNLSLLNPKGKTINIDSTHSPLVITDTYYAGQYLLRGKGFEKRFVANLFDESESGIKPSLTPGKKLEFEEAKVVPFVKEEKKELGKYILVVVSLLLLTEWILYYLKARARVV